MAAPFDPNRGEITGVAVPVVESLRQAINAGGIQSSNAAGQFSFSASGSLAYAPGGIFPPESSRLVWVDRSGNVEPLAGVPAGKYLGPRISPDGERVAVWKFTSGIWIYNVSATTWSRLGSNETADQLPVWTPDGKRLSYSSNDNVHWKLSDSSGPSEPLTTQGGFPSPGVWTPDGQTLAIARGTLEGALDVWLVPLGGEPRPFIESPGAERWPSFSPDGAWLAYGSDETGRNEIYVVPVPGPGSRAQVSTEGGREPAWSRDGRELFYRGPELADGSRSMLVVDVTTRPEFTKSTPRELFRWQGSNVATSTGYDVTPDGQRFVMTADTREVPPPVTELHVVLNWFDELERVAR